MSKITENSFKLTFIGFLDRKILKIDKRPRHDKSFLGGKLFKNKSASGTFIKHSIVCIMQNYFADML